MLGKNNDKLVEKDKGFLDDAVAVIINLIHSQFHAELSYLSTGDEKWLKLAEECRKDRTELLDLITDNEGEKWCFNKHILFCAGGYMELGARAMSREDVKLSKKYYEKAGKWLSFFYELNKLGGR